MNTSFLFSRFLRHALAWVALAAASLSAQPAYINYQGTLLDDAGALLATDAYAMAFSVYDAATEGAVVWGPLILDGAPETGHGPLVRVANGRFNVVLGPVDTAGRPIAEAFNGEARFIEITVGEGSPILPRQQVLSAPYALKTTGITVVDGRIGIGETAPATDVHIRGEAMSSQAGRDYFMVPRGAIILWAGSVTDIPAGWALCDGANGTPDLRNRFVYGWGEQAVGTTGGSTSHTHFVDIPPFTSGNASTSRGGYVAATRNDDLTHDHTHSINPPNTQSTSSEHLPPYYRLAYLMRL
jgi:hypothetical protein